MLLVINSGYINAIALTGYFHTSVGNMTGNATELGINLGGGKTTSALDLLFVILAFLAGAIVNGIYFSTSTFSTKNRYGISLLVQALLALASYFCVKHKDALVLHTAEYLLAAAAGMQNSMTTIYSGAIIRTTHVTGIIADLGLSIGRIISGRLEDLWKVNLYFWTIICFILGAFLGIHFYHLFKLESVLFSVGAIFLASMMYLIYRMFLNLTNHA